MSPIIKRSSSPRPISKKTGLDFSENKEKIKDLSPINYINKQVKSYQTRQLEDPFSIDYNANIAGSLSIIMPPFNPHSLRRLPNENNILRQCIDAMVTNIESYGSRLEYVGDHGEELSREAQSEYLTLNSFLTEPNGDETLIDIRSKLRKDLETFGYAFLEVTRDGTEAIATMYHIPAHTVRLTVPDHQKVTVNKILTRNGKQITVKVAKKFRRFVQKFSSKKVFFKEFGDPRTISSIDGMVNDNLSLEQSASELIHLSLYDSSTAYGVPRWINQLPSVMGSRESELVNLDFFQNNGVPNTAVLVSGAALTEESIRDIEQHFTSAKGRESMNRVVVVEAIPSDNVGSVDGNLPTPKLDIKNLSDGRQKDSLFQEYDSKCQSNIRSSFRLPPIFLGKSEDYTRATADASLVVAEGQIFIPERNRIDDLFNKIILPNVLNQNLKFWRFKSNPPKLVAKESMVDAVTALNNMGAMTPNTAISLANELFDLEINLISSSWGNYPFIIVQKFIDQGKELEGLDDLFLTSEIATVKQHLQNNSTLNDEQKTIIDNTFNLLTNVKVK